MGDSRSDLAATLMASFAERTGITGAAPPRRYLWTDAFAVCNFLGLGREDLADRLIDQVHHVLGRHRPDDHRTGWISGLAEADGEAHPTLGGLRIGKSLPERRDDEPFDEALEWERDGQYFHYLTKWMVALDRRSRRARDERLLAWARELAVTAHRQFTYVIGNHKRMCWKMSIDLTRPLVASMGQHDPLDGLITCLELEASADALGTPVRGPALSDAIADFTSMLDIEGLATTDPLGLGGLLVDAHRLARLRTQPKLVEALLVAAVRGARYYATRPDLRRAPSLRLAFRELGLAIGLAAVPGLDRISMTPNARNACVELDNYVQLRRLIEDTWATAEHRVSSAWTEHRDINDVMLATALAPAGFLDG